MTVSGVLKRKIREAIAPVLVRQGWRAPHGTPLKGLNGGEPFGYDEELQIRQAATKVSLNTMATFERLATLWQQVRYLDRYKIPGALVECGVWKGGSAGMMALAHTASSASPFRELHLFDSFEGLPEPRFDKDGNAAVEYSGQRGGGGLNPIHQCVGTLPENRDLIEKEIGYRKDLVNYHVGWFENTVPPAGNMIGQIALLRLDGDWYESTRVCLQNLYPKVAAGGVVVIDDYGHWEGCRKAVDEFLSTMKEPVLLNHIDYTGRYWVRMKCV
jgi:hypothetical protein